MGEEVKKTDELREALVSKFGGGPRGEDAANVFELMIKREVAAQLAAPFEVATATKPTKTKAGK